MSSAYDARISFVFLPGCVLATAYVPVGCVLVYLVKKVLGIGA